MSSAFSTNIDPAFSATEVATPAAPTSGAWNLDTGQTAGEGAGGGGGAQAVSTITPSGGQQPGQQSSVYNPGRPNYLQYAQKAGFGLNDLTSFYKSLYSDVNDPNKVDASYKSPVQDPLQNSTTENSVTTSQPTPIADPTVAGNELSGWATTFGLDPGTVVNPDGTVDSKYFDKEDNGYGAFGYNTRDPNLVGASLPIEVIKQSIGDYQNNPKIWSQIHEGNYKVAVTNGQGVTKVMKIVDAGPAAWTGNLVDLTYGATKSLGFSGKNQAKVQIIGPDGKTVPIKGFHPSTVRRAPPKPSGEPPQREAEVETPPEKKEETPPEKKEETPSPEVKDESKEVLSVPSKADIAKRAAQAREEEKARKQEEEAQNDHSSRDEE